MSERILTGYKRLFEVRLLHHYWLDEGQTLFDALSDEKKEKRLLQYDVRSFLSVVPAAATQKALQGLQGVFRNTALGFVVAVPQERVIPDEAVFAFVLTVRHPGFFNYTALTLSPRRIYELYHEAEDTLYRYKEHVPVFSNLTGVTRGVAPLRSLFLSRERPPLKPTDKVESLILAGAALQQLTSDQPGANIQPLHALASGVPVFMHQDDAPLLVPPPGLAGVPTRGIALSEEIPDSVFALVRIAALKPGDADFSCTAGGLAKARHPVFQIRFKNRSTVWQYFDKSTGALVTTLPLPLPLTRYGQAGTRQRPTEGYVKVAFDPVLPTRITGVFSEIYE